MNVQRLNVICYAICIICIIAGVVVALVLIWGDVGDEIAWKAFSTIAVLFLASTLTLAVNKLIDRPGQRPLG